MGGGTTVVEALRLGCKVICIDLNPIAWFIVKTEIESVELNSRDRSSKLVVISGKARRLTRW
jgi:adenine-specific DNA methylase